MNLKNFLRFFVVQSLVLLTNLQEVQAFSFHENSQPLLTIPFQTNESISSQQFVTAPFVAFTGVKNFFVSQNLERNLGGLLSKMETLLSPLAFSLLLFLMLAYWSQAAFLGRKNIKL